MTFSSHVELLDPASIIVLRDERQRREIDVGDLLPSIKKNGQINPIVVTKGMVLITGERRLESCKQLGIQVRTCFAEDLSALELQIIEAEENFKRSDLIWQDQVMTIGRVHKLCCQLDPEWTMGETGDKLSLSVSTVSMYLTVMAAMDDPHIVAAGTAREAYNALLRRRQRELGNELEELLGGSEPEEELLSATIEAVANGAELPAAPVAPKPPAPTSPDESIQQANFLDWAPAYKGKPFNLIHCDFPYGANVFGGAQGKGTTEESGHYNDDKETYFELLESFCKNFDNFASFSCHVMFWFSFRHYDTTRQIFRNFLPSLEFTLHPLIWVKSDNAGIVSDSRRDPRHVYEMALLGRRGGRMSVKAVGDAYSAPSDRSQHASTKPEPMLRHFFGMLCNSQSSVLDPTCGSGTAIRAAESLGAERVLGLELNLEVVTNARQLLRNARVLRNANKSIEELVE